ncbi:DUF6113 family protein [Jatrophihabitans sp. DSM 45814]
MTEIPLDSTQEDRDAAAGAVDGTKRRSVLSGELPTSLKALGLVLYAIAGAMSAVFEILLIPFRIGSVLVPIALVLAIASNIALPRLARNLTESPVGSIVPVITWILVNVMLTSTRPEGDYFLPGGGTVQWVSYGVPGLGVLTGLITVSLLYAPAGRRRQFPPRR